MLRTKPDTTAHPAGGWTVTRSKISTDGAFDYAISAEGAPVIAEAFGRDAKGGWPDAQANAYLMAAAPDLLNALKAMDAVLCDGFETQAKRFVGRKALIAARAAIAKAEGRQP